MPRPNHVATTRALLASLDKAGKIPILHLTAAHIHTSGKLAKDRPRKGGPRTLLDWQSRRFKRLVPEQLRRVLAPMGAGKSTLVCALALHDLDQGLKQIVCYPQRAIAPGFARRTITLPNGVVREWCPRKPPEETETVEDIVKFVLARPTADENARSVICTHAALVRAFDRLSSMKLRGEIGGDPWKGMALSIDEGHHSMYEEGDVDDDTEPNELGKVVRHYIRNKSGPLTVVTATWLRSEGSIIPAEMIGLFACDPYPIDEYLESLKFLRDTRIRFIVGPQLDSFRSIVASDPLRKTIAYLPLGMKPNEKRAMLNACQAAVRKDRLRVCDLVTDDHGRDARRDELFKSIKEQVHAWDSGVPGHRLPANTPELILALNMFREGADWPEASRAILLAPRGSVVDTIQILGRLLRDWPGKREVEFNIILPVAPGGTVDPEKMGDYLKVIFASMVVEWQFKRVHLLPKARTPAARRARARLADLDTFVRVMGGLANAAIEHDGDERAFEAGRDEVLVNELFDENDDVRKHVADELSVADHFFKTTTARRILREAKDVPLDPKLREELRPNGFGVFKVWASLLGWKDLRELRLALGKNIPLSVEYIDQKIIEYAMARGWKPPKGRSAKAAP